MGNGLMKNFLLACIACFAAVMITGAAHAQSGEVIAENGDWISYKAGSGKNTECFITSQPTKYQGNYDRNNRGETRVFVSHHEASEGIRGEVSVVAGYKYKTNSEVTFNIDGKNFTLFTVDTRAWATKPSQDKAIVSAMKKGRTLKVTGTSSRGNKTIDTYSLKGFTAAMKKIDKTCS